MFKKLKNATRDHFFPPSQGPVRVGQELGGIGGQPAECRRKGGEEGQAQGQGQAQGTVWYEVGRRAGK